jgi:hypothetical protein
MKNFAKLYEDATSLKSNLERQKVELTEAEKQSAKLEEAREKDKLALERYHWLQLPYTNKFLRSLEREELEGFELAKSFALSNLLDDEASAKKLIELVTIEKVINLAMKGIYARTNEKQ